MNDPRSRRDVNAVYLTPDDLKRNGYVSKEKQIRI